MIVTRDPAIAATMRSLRNQGRPPSETDNWLQHTELGYNYRLSDIACTLGLGQLRRLPEILARRAAVARLYHHHLASERHLILPSLEVPDARISWFVFVARLTPSFTAEDRDDLVARLHGSGIACARYFAPIHLQPAYTAYRHAQLPVTESIAARTLALPFFNRLTEPEIVEVSATLRAALAGRTRPEPESHRK